MITAHAHQPVVELPSRRAARNVVALAIVSSALAGCYVVPVNPDGTLSNYPVPGTVMTIPASPPPGESGSPRPAYPASLPIRLYPANDLANQTGMLTGTVTNLMTGRGRFQFNYQGETLAGEATRVANDERRGLASAHGPRGTFARCEYQMTTAYMGAGTCAFSNGAQYQVHIGN